MNQILAWFLTFNFVTITWVFFRAKNWSDAGKILRAMNPLGVQFEHIEDLRNKMLFLILFGIIAFLAKNSVQLQKEFRPTWKNAAFCLFLVAIGIINLTKVREFIYFNF